MYRGTSAAIQEHVLFTCNKCEFDIETQTNLKTHNKCEHAAKDCYCSFTSGEDDNIKVVDASVTFAPEASM